MTGNTPLVPLPDRADGGSGMARLAEHRDGAMPCGMNDFVMKPFNPAYLFEGIRAHLNTPS